MNNNNSMVAPHSKREIKPDVIFGTAKQAQDAIDAIGFDKVINSTIGAMTDDDGKLMFLEAVMTHIRNLPDVHLGAYAPIAGVPRYIEKIQEACFRGNKPDGFIEAVATPGGTGAIKHAVWNYTDMGDKILTSDWFWAPYGTIASEHGRKIDTYKFFDENSNYNINSLKEKVKELIEVQDRLLIIINTPAHNPTGFTVEDTEWEEITKFLKETAELTNKKITLFVDVAYIDFAGTIKESREFFKFFTNLPQNLLVLVGFSMSKGYTLYGMRSGAIICIAPTQEIATEFQEVCSFSNRAAWSNGTRPAMETLADVFTDKDLFDAVENEREEFRLLLDKRAETFMKNAKESGLVTAPYKAGYFISIPCDDPTALCDELKKENLFVIPLAMGIRFAPCAVSEAKCAASPAIIKMVMDRMEGILK